MNKMMQCAMFPGRNQTCSGPQKHLNSFLRHKKAFSSNVDKLNRVIWCRGPLVVTHTAVVAQVKVHDEVSEPDGGKKLREKKLWENWAIFP